MHLKPLAALALTTILLFIGCSKPKPVVVGSKDTTEQRILAEILAQHLGRKLSVPVETRLGLGDTRTAHQVLLNGEISLYPEYSGLIITELLKEPPAAEAEVTLERARLEMKRIARLEYVSPLGFDAQTVMVVAAEGNEGIGTVTQAAASANRWKVGVTYEFQGRSSGLQALNLYRLEMGAPIRTMNEAELFPAMEDAKNPINLVATSLSDGHLTLSKWKVLADDRNVFPHADAAMLVRDDVLAAVPELRAALNDLAGKISLETMRRLNAQVVLEEKKIADVASAFLKSVGLE